MLQTAAKIYVSHQRGYTELDGFRRFSTFNFDTYFDAHKQPFGALKALNDNTLAAEKNITLEIEAHTSLMLIPIIGGIEIKNNVGYHEFINAGEVLIIADEKGINYEIINPYNSDLINFLEIAIENKANLSVNKTELKCFNLDNKNQLLSIYTSNNNQNLGFIGKYEGRKDGIYTLKNTQNGVFVFVIHGAFEVANRLLESRDGLALSNIETVEFEALSSDAILLLFEIEK